MCTVTYPLEVKSLVICLKKCIFFCNVILIYVLYVRLAKRLNHAPLPDVNLECIRLRDVIKMAFHQYAKFESQYKVETLFFWSIFIFLSVIICTMLNGRTFSVILTVTVVFYSFRIGDGNQKTQGISFLSYSNIFVLFL